jgi:hypothetical protein
MPSSIVGVVETQKRYKMACTTRYIKIPSPEDELNLRRNQDLARIERELAMGMARIEVDPITGAAKLMGASVQPQGMGDLCVLDALQQRNSVEFQLAAAHAGVQDRNFAVTHVHSHTHHHHGSGGHHH